MIPKDADSLLEVGCGEGRIINTLQNQYEKIFGMDISDEALKHVETPKIKGRIENIPFPDNSFDIVLCCEVLEHLPSPIYEKALKEIQRVSKKYILISVPNEEDIQIGKIKCPHCASSFHVYGHLRSFNLSNMKDLFGVNKLVKYEIVSNYVFLFHELVIKIKKWFKRDFFTFEDARFCPKCGFTLSKNIGRVKKSPYFLERLPFRFPMKKSGGWIIALYDERFL
jgi:ubiquinone/menaquinone biosynthesis C-methylase UbiE